MRDRGPADDRILWVDLADLPRRAVASPRRACARAVVNNAFKKIEAEYGEQSVGAEAEVFQRRQDPAAVSRTDVEAARSNWRTGQRGGDPEDSFKRGRGDAVDPDIRSSGPYFGCAAAQEPSASSPARASARVIPRWNKENFGPVSAVSRIAASNPAFRAHLGRGANEKLFSPVRRTRSRRPGRTGASRPPRHPPAFTSSAR